jgi:hypothetical protein
MRKPRRFVPAALHLEQRAATAPVFMADPGAPPYEEAVTYDIDALGGNFGVAAPKSGQAQAHQGWNPRALDDQARPPLYSTPRGTVRGVETATVSLATSGPHYNPIWGPTQTTQVTITTTQSTYDEVNNQTPDALSFALANQHNFTTAGGGYALFIENQSMGANLEIHFVAHYECTLTAPFESDPQLILNVGPYVQFTVGQDNGLQIFDGSGTPLPGGDPNFGTTTCAMSNVDVDMTVPVPDGPLDVNFNSSLYSYPTDAFMPPSADTVNQANFQWSLTLNVS